MNWEQLIAYAPRANLGGSPEDAYSALMNPANQEVNVPGVGAVHFQYDASGKPIAASVITPEGGMMDYAPGADGNVKQTYRTPAQRKEELTNKDWTNSALGPIAALGIPAAASFLGAGALGGSASSAPWTSGYDLAMGNTAGLGEASAPGWVSGYDLAEGGALTPSATSGGLMTPAPPGGLDYAEGVANGTISTANGAPYTLADTLSTATGGALPPSAAAKLAAAGLTTSQVATAAKEPGLLDRLLSGAATTSDIAKLGLGAAAIGALASENPDRTTTTKIEYPDWYNSGSKSALALADKFAALGPDAVAPLSANETQAIQMAKDSAGNWKPLIDQSTATLDASKGYFDKAGALAGSVPGYLDRAIGQIDAAMPYFGKAGAMADTVSGYLNRSGALADEAAGGIPSINLSDYMNPYLDNVLAPIARRNEIAKAGALNDIKAKAGMRGAFGGSRSTLLEGQTAEAADRNMNEAEANIRSGAFTTGLSAAQADLARKLAASGQFGNLGSIAGNTANTYTNTGKAIADTAGAFNNMGVVATGGANANTNIGRSLTDTAAGYKANAGALGTLTDADIARLTSTGGIERGVEQAKRNAPLTAIGGYANALRGNPGSNTTVTAPEASKLGQVTGALTTLLGANKAGWI